MGDKTKIEWADSSWNPLIAYGHDDKRGWFCTRVSEGCRNCYASQLNQNRRFGNGLDYKAQNRQNARLELHELTLLKPLHWKRPRRIFTNSMTDIFGTDFGVTWEMLDKIYAVMALTPQHTYLNLTKRPDVRLDYLSRVSPAHIGLIAAKMVQVLGIKNAPSRKLIVGSLEECGWPLPNVWEGVSVEDQETANTRSMFMRETPAALRFISQEPQISLIDWTTDMLRGINWLILGGESGPNARPFNIDWARQAIAQCDAAGVPVFLKQLGAKPLYSVIGGGEPYLPWHTKDKKGGEESEWPLDLQGRSQFPR